MTDFSSFTLQLGATEIENLRSDIEKSCIGIFFIALIGLGFFFLFKTTVPHDTLFERLFVWSPPVLCGAIALFIAYQTFNYYRDLNAGDKLLLTGTVTEKLVKSSGKLPESSIHNLPDRMSHCIKVDGKLFLIQGPDYDQCQVGNHVKMYISHYSRRVFDFEFNTCEIDYNQFNHRQFEITQGTVNATSHESLRSFDFKVPTSYRLQSLRNHIVYTTDNRVLLTSDDAIIVADYETGKKVKEIKMPDRTDIICMALHGNRLIAGDKFKGTLNKYDLTSGKLVRTFGDNVIQPINWETASSATGIVMDGIFNSPSAFFKSQKNGKIESATL